MTNSTRDSLSIYRAEAKRLHRSFKSGNPQARKRVAPYFSPVTQLTLQQAQLVIARESGEESWSKLARRVTQGDRQLDVMMADIQDMLERAFIEARERKHAEFTVEHLLQAILRDNETARFIGNLGSDTQQLMARVDNVVNMTRAGKEPQPDFPFQRVIQTVMFEGRSPEPRPITIPMLLLAILDEEESASRRLLLDANITPQNILAYIGHQD
ncbi:MAG: Clp protease N-terminal domain-containing protein [Pseudomonadota bacterium]